jgi:predicted ATPase
MITRLYFKNWRSLREVEITDLTPITVFIGANSSGKSNILDALRFLQYSGTEGNRGIVGAVRYKWGGADKIRTIGAPENEPIEIEFSLKADTNVPLLTQKIAMRFSEKEPSGIMYNETRNFGTQPIWNFATNLPVGIDFMKATMPGAFGQNFAAVNEFVHTYVARRWQLFKELF